MQRKLYPTNSRMRRPGLQFALGLLLLTAPGCMRMMYDRIELGSSPREFERHLASGDTRQTDLGRASFHRDRSGRSDAIVVLTRQDRRAAGKIHVTYVEGDWRTGGARCRMVGVIDRERYGVAEVGPIDTLRLIWRDLLTSDGETRVQQSHALVGVGIERFLSRLDDAASAAAELTAEPAPHAAWSQARITLPAEGSSLLRDDDGRIEFEYVAGASWLP